MDFRNENAWILFNISFIDILSLFLGGQINNFPPLANGLVPTSDG